jgi:hypothetical protein
MPAIRVILVRLFPKVMGNTTKSNTNQYSLKCATAGQYAGGSKMGGSRTQAADQSFITYTKTFDVQTEDRERRTRGDDEIGLVIVEDDNTREERKTISGSSSQVSV